MSSILAPHSPLEVLLGLCCDIFEILGLVSATVTLGPPSLGGVFNFYFHFLFGYKGLAMASILVPHSPLEVLF
jgi:hypothetical protein